MKFVFPLMVILAAAALAGEKSGTVQSTRLYTPPDPAAHGGLRARVTLPGRPVLQVFAMPAADPRRVYQGEVLAGGQEFVFTGLPVAKYDLMLLCEDGFYEGFTLTRAEDTLTARDRELIEGVIRRAVPFFDTKEIHRLAGTTGREGQARCVLQELRTRKILAQSAEVLKGYQIRSIKLAWLEDVGSIGWQLANTREIVRQEVAPGDRAGVLPHHYCPALGGWRVTDEMKNLGILDLSARKEQP